MFLSKKIEHCLGLSAALVTSAALLFSSCAPKSRLKVGQSAQGEVVEAEGFAPMNNGDLLAIKRASLVDAQKNAVEKAVGVFVSARTMVEKAVAIENNILAKTDGYVKKYDIIDERKDKDMYRTKIRALVAVKDLEDDLKDLSMLNMPPLEKPRVMVSLVESIDDEPSEDKVAQAALEKSLGDAGYSIASSTAPGQADLLVSGKVTSHPFQSEGLGGFVSNRARLTVQVSRTGAKDLLFSTTKEASGLGGSQQLAGFKSLETVGQLAGTDIAEQIANKWKKSKSILVFVENVQSFDEAERIRKHLASQPGVSDLALRLYDEKMAQFELLLANTKPTELVSALASSQSLPVAILESSDQMIRLKMADKK